MIISFCWLFVSQTHRTPIALGDWVTLALFGKGYQFSKLKITAEKMGVNKLIISKQPMIINAVSKFLRVEKTYPTPLTSLTNTAIRFNPYRLRFQMNAKFIKYRALDISHGIGYILLIGLVWCVIG